jgi:hypothetical protein
MHAVLGEAKMDLEKIVKFAEGFGRDYVLTILSILWNPYPSYAEGKAAEGTADAQLTIVNGRTFSYAVISIALGTMLYTAAMGHQTKLSELSIPLVLLTLVLWFLLAGIIHIIERLFGSELVFADTASVCLRIMPLAYVLSAMLIFAVSIFAEQYIAADKKVLVLGMAFLAFQVAILAVYFPAAMRRAHRTNIWSHIVMTVAVVSFVGVVNFVGFDRSGARPANMSRTEKIEPGSYVLPR